MERLKYNDNWDAITIGIIIGIPFNSLGECAYSEEMEGCPKCSHWEPGYCKSYEGDGNKRIPTTKYCSRCGTANEIRMIEQKPEPVPNPDIRTELSKLGLDYVPFIWELDKEGSWLIIVKEFDTFGHRSDWCGGALRKYDVTEISEELRSAQKKYGKLLKKYSGSIWFGSISCCADW